MPLERVHGHDTAKWYLSRMLETGDFPNSLLFHGPEGVGKFTLALELAKALNCKTQEASCECASCSRIEQDQHQDVLVFRPEGKTGYLIEQVRTLIGQTQHGRTEGEWKVFILENAETLPAKTADALLKTLEEGEERVLFILISQQKDALPGTLVSRSLDFYLGHLPYEAVLTALQEQHPDFKSGLLTKAARLGAGSLGRAQQFLQPETMARRDAIFDLLLQYPSIPEYVIIEFVDAQAEHLTEVLDLLQRALADVCLAIQGQPLLWQNADRMEDIERLGRTFGRKSFDALGTLQTLGARLRQPVAQEHQMKSALFDLKGVFR